MVTVEGGGQGNSLTGRLVLGLVFLQVFQKFLDVVTVRFSDDANAPISQALKRTANSLFDPKVACDFHLCPNNPLACKTAITTS